MSIEPTAFARRLLSLLALCAPLYGLPALAQDAPDNPLLGTWELVEVLVPNIEMAEKHGIRNVKEYYAADGFLYVIPAEGKLAANTPKVPYSLRGDRRITKTRDGQEVEAEVRFPDPDTLELEHRHGDIWRYRRLKGEDAQSRRLTPVSVEQIQMGSARKGGGYVARDQYDRSDYSHLPLKERLLGTWERVEVLDASEPRERPYGFFNDVWRFSPREVAILLRASNDGTTMPYKLEGEELHLSMPDDKGVFTARLSFDDWGRLIVDRGNRKEIFLRVNRDPEREVQLPFRVVLLKAVW